MLTIRALLGVSVVVVLATAAVAESESSHALLDAEETYELRLQLVMQRKGNAALVDRLKRDFERNPRPYVKAWYANYLLYGEELGVKELADPKRGFALAREARDEGSVFALELVGRAYGDGRGVGFKDTMEALRLLSQAAEAGRDSAMCELAKYHFFGIGVPLDREKAATWARRGAWLGATGGLMNLAAWWEDPKYVTAPDHARSLELYYEAAELGAAAAARRLEELAKGGDALAERYTRIAFVVGAREGAVAYPTQLKAAVRWLETNASADDPLVQLALAELMIERTGPVYDAKAAMEKLTRLAAAGNPDARALLGWMAWRGIGRTSDPAGAIRAWRELAAQDNARALNALGWLHWWGGGEKHGVEKDAARAFALCRRAADQGNWVAQRNVADCYAHGIGTDVNYYLAAKYYQTLAQRGFIRGRDMRERMLTAARD